MSTAPLVSRPARTAASVAAAPIPPVHAELLDCVQSNLAVLADHFHGLDTHLALGATLRMRPRAGAGGLPTVEPLLDDQLAEARLLGLVEELRLHDVPASELAALAARHGTLYVVADAFHMSWLPYFGRRHMEHSYLVSVEPGDAGPAPDAGGMALVTDAYHNRTPWGLISPGRWTVPWSELPVSSLVLVLGPAATGAPILTPGTRLDPAGDYVAAYAEHPDRVAALTQLTVETWLLARSRRLHAEFLAATGAPERPGTEAHLRRWHRLAEQTFLALRRVDCGRPEPERLWRDLAAAFDGDREVFGGGDPLRDAVAETVAQVCGTDVVAVLAASGFADLPGFDSFRVVEIVEGLERRLGVEFDPDDLVPENLHRLDDLRRLVGRSTSSANRP
ncbi:MULTISPECIES: acyl carrier protein [unclassified Micromonospora]|uniref:acyl carrier protein n=1 Tax=unclassified Micromonospora TaxID=2617518 RepID=UPI00364233D5